MQKKRDVQVFNPFFPHIRRICDVQLLDNSRIDYTFLSYKRTIVLSIFVLEPLFAIFFDT